MGIRPSINDGADEEYREGGFATTGHFERRGVYVTCAVCGQRKCPRGRSAPDAMANSMCNYDCAGYNQEPHVGSLWPREWESDFGYAISDVGTERAWREDEDEDEVET